MSAAPLSSYRSPSNHEAVSAIIRRRSTNKIDVREAALSDLDLSLVRNVLDLGCGFGFMAEALASRVAPDATLIGVDVWPSNEPSFLEKVAATGRQGRFVCTLVDSQLPYSDQSFDLVVCSYSLYFFVDVLPEVARILAPNGIFVAITHSEHGLVGDLPAAGFAKGVAGLLALVRKFSAENGRKLLEDSFSEITRIDYQNSLRFQADHVEELLSYMKFKLPFLVPGSDPADDLPEALTRYAKATLSRTGEVVIIKNDAVFRCRSPICR